MRTGVVGEHIGAAYRVIEFAVGGWGKNVIVGQLAEVDRRLRDLERAGRRYIADHVGGQPLADDRVHGACGGAIAVCVPEVDVHPVLCGGREFRGVHLSRADLELLILTVDHVAVDVDVVEGVVRADGLLLLIRLLQRDVVPQPQVVDRRLIVLHVLGGERLVAREVAHANVGEPVGRARAGYLALYVRELIRLGVRGDGNALHDRGVRLSQHR